MRNDFYVKIMILVCAVAGCLAGYGIDGLFQRQQQKENAKDNTLVREEYDGVFFDGESMPTATPLPEEGVLSPKPTMAPEITPVKRPVVTRVPKEEPEARLTIGPTPDGAETITYPAQIFGQTPVVDRTDEYVTYFEFAMDLISEVEDEIRQRKLNEAALFSKFMLKALFCGIDIRSIRINEPIPRDQAALAIHLAAELMEEKGTGTTANSAGKYVTDIDGCSSSERKAIAYLYEQGIATGYQVTGQSFLPDGSLSEKEITAWMMRVRECWK